MLTRLNFLCLDDVQRIRRWVLTCVNVASPAGSTNTTPSSQTHYWTLIKSNRRSPGVRRLRDYYPNIGKLWRSHIRYSQLPLGAFLCIPTPNTGQLKPLFHTFAEFRPIVNRVVARQSTDWLAVNAQFSPNASVKFRKSV